MPADRADWKDAWEHRPRWGDYAISVLALALLTAVLEAIHPLLPLGDFPVTYVLVIMLIAYALGTGPAIVACVIAWLFFDYFFVHPLYTLFWPIAVGKQAWAKQVAFVLGITVVSIVMIQARKTRQRIQRFADEATASNASLSSEIEERRVVEQALRESEDRFRTVFSSMPVGLVIIDPDTLKFLISNEAAAEYLGYSREEMSNLTVAGIEAIHDEELVRRNVSRFASGTVMQFESKHRTKQGQLRDVLVRGQGFEMDGRRLALAIWVDISERKKAEDEVRRLNAELEQRVAARTAELEASNRELEAFSYSVSHDLRAPLRAIDGFSNAVLKGYAESLDDRGQDYLTRIRAAAQRMAQLIDDILNLSRATRVEMQREPIDMTAAAAAIIAELRKSQPGRQIDVEIQQGLTVNADPHLFDILLTNLISNAWKFTGKREVARIEVGVAPDRVYYIRDNGAGFNPSYADKLFSPFQRLHSEDEFPGTGIGLALVQRIVRRHGGRIWAESAVDRGATFYFTLGEAVE